MFGVQAEYSLIFKPSFLQSGAFTGATREFLSVLLMLTEQRCPVG